MNNLAYDGCIQLTDRLGTVEYDWFLFLNSTNYIKLLNLAVQ